MNAKSTGESAQEWLVLTGTAVDGNAESLNVELANSELMIVAGRAWAYALEQGLTVGVGDKVTLYGFYEEGEFKVGQIENLSSAQMVTLHNLTGRPNWAGTGRRGG